MNIISRASATGDRHGFRYEALSVQRNAPRRIKMPVKHGFIPANANA
ncbi:MAG: hypothetical protein HY777_14315 [Betaproteobacteria bacterium]|nr:hypothetical protein [Betaproteobacteria bacterium]